MDESNDKIDFSSRLIFNSEPPSIIMDLDNWPYGNGFKDIKFKTEGKEYVFTKKEIIELLDRLKRMSLED